MQLWCSLQGLEHNVLFSRACVQSSLPGRAPAISCTSKVQSRVLGPTRCPHFPGSSTSPLLRLILLGAALSS